ncbi:DinB family protein [Marinoscillum furvescens]|uniref:Putative damage-inducible protein DinB n=1 Tax=Marinoscillum furvescens DSM 4134 TaxID=1122208 RepID=A0A3D9L3K3_MARFU|nr:DinB family protein [Marinoscillum furvescens]RED99876.1 putative damage-inducible protein DinB [Marinoscillum furvescens DSM 4134]
MNLHDLTAQLNEVYEGQPWFGNSIATYLQEIEDSQIGASVSGSRSIGQIINHMIVWREYVLDKLEGRSNSLRVNSPEDWPLRSYKPEDKAPLFTRLKTTQKKLNEALKQQDDTLLTMTVPGEPRTFEQLLTGIIYHDIYHLGQIYLIKSSLEKKSVT